MWGEPTAYACRCCNSAHLVKSHTVTQCRFVVGGPCKGGSQTATSQELNISSSHGANRVQHILQATRTTRPTKR